MKRTGTGIRGNRSRGGFSMVELVMGIAAAAVVVISSGLMVYYTHLGYRRESAAVNLQRDATAIMDLLCHAIRGCSMAGVSISAGTLSIQNGGVTASFRRSNSGDFVYDPDTAISGNDVVVATGVATAFTPEFASGGVSVQVNLQSGTDNAQVGAVVFPRN